MNYKQIVWLSSYPKSGNTWLRCFFDAYITGEVDINNIVSSVTDDSAPRALPGDGSDPSKFPIDVQMLARPMGMLRLVRQFELNKTETGIDIPLFVKTHNAHLVTNGIELLSQQLTKSVIYIVRDPRDVVVSFAKHMGKDVDQALEYFFDKYRVLQDDRHPKMADFISSWPNAVASYVSADTHNVKIIKYEDMKARPVDTFSRIVRHAGLAVDQERVEKALELVSLEKLKAQEKKDGFKESSPHAKNSFFGDGGGWEDKLTQSQIFKIEKGCRTMMKKLGYKPSMRVAA